MSVEWVEATVVPGATLSPDADGRITIDPDVLRRIASPRVYVRFVDFTIQTNNVFISVEKEGDAIVWKAGFDKDNLTEVMRWTNIPTT